MTWMSRMPGKWPTPPVLKADWSFRIKNKKHTKARLKWPNWHINWIKAK